MKPSPGSRPEDRRPRSAPSSAMAAALQAIVQTREIREALGALIPAVVQLWAGSTPLKKRVARPVARSIERSLRPSPAEDRGPGDSLADHLPDVLNALLAEMEIAAAQWEGLPPEEMGELVKRLGEAFGTGQTGRILTRLMRGLHDLHRTRPTALAEAISPAILNWIEATDFGALRDAADTMGPEVAALARDINAVLWRYPAKLVLLLSFLPDLLNAAVVVLQETLRRFNQASPDLVADITLALFRAVDGEALGCLMNELAEVLRKIHTGSALIGEAGRPQFQQDTAQAMRAALHSLDSRLYWGARVALAEDRAALAHSLGDVLTAHPDFVTEALKTIAARKNPGLRTTRLRLEALEDIPDDDLSGALEQGLSTLDLQEVGDIANLASGLANRVTALKPALIPDLARQLAAALDADEIQDAAGAFLAAAGPAAVPILRALLPDLLSLLGDALEPIDDHHEAQMRASRRRLRALLLEAEAVP